MGDNLDDAEDVFTYEPMVKKQYAPVFAAPLFPRSAPDVPDSFYSAAEILVKGVVAGKLSEDIEGITGLFLFRHYLELALKRIVVSGRWLETPTKNAEEIEKVKCIHSLQDLWTLVESDAKPKIAAADWKAFDTDFVRRCLLEFHQVDPKGVSFRYRNSKLAELQTNFSNLLADMRHCREVLEGIDTYLVETHGQNEEWEEILNSL